MLNHRIDLGTERGAEGAVAMPARPMQQVRSMRLPAMSDITKPARCLMLMATVREMSVLKPEKPIEANQAYPQTATLVGRSTSARSAGVMPRRATIQITPSTMNEKAKNRATTPRTVGTTLAWCIRRLGGSAGSA